MRCRFWRLLLPLLLCCPTLAFAAPYQIKKIPYANYLPADRLTVVLSFDGSRDLRRWQEILDFARSEQVRMTFYVSGVYFLTDAEKDRYGDPADPQRRGYSLIGFGGPDATVAERKALVLSALRDGHDIESHLNGHFDASQWSRQTWEREFASFYSLAAFLPHAPQHVRFPLLAMNDRVYPVMAEYGVKTIASVAGKEPGLFHRITVDHQGRPYTFLEFPIPPQQESGGRFILMDYNIYLHDQRLKRTPQQAEEKTVELYLAEAQRCLDEGRPLFISHHFSPWNDDAYWRAMQRTVQLLKERYPVRFVTIAELYAALEEQSQVATHPRPTATAPN